MTFPFFILSFLSGRLGSVLLYRAAWNNGLERRFHPWGALATLLGRPWPWLAHLPVLALGAGLDWSDMPMLRIYAVAAGGSLALGAVGRWGAADLGRFFLFDRCLILVLWAGLWLSPAFLYPLLLSCCCLQYTVSGWPLQPGYSNLLGFEFLRSSLCMLLAALLVPAFLGRAGFAGIPIGAEAHGLALILAGQAAGYVQQALAKCALGRRWYSWILENRLQCLPVNAWLRGWGAAWRSKAGVLRLARWMARFRIPLCAAAWSIEIGWLFVLTESRLAAGIFAATAVFHLAVWLLAGLAGYHFLISHALMLLIAASPSAAGVFGPDHALPGLACIAVSSIGVLLLRRKLFREYSRSGSPGPWGRAADPADHLMAWWDGPYMRMYSYSVTTVSGRRFRFPVTRFSPYDTFLTDMHTHLMILGRSWDLDPCLAADREAARTGVWGLCVDPAVRDRLYAWMDDPQADLRSLNPPPASQDGQPAKAPGRYLSEADGSPLAAFFHGLNAFRSKGWFRILFRWPHFPGEDLVPDWSPLADVRFPEYDGAEPVAEAAVHCIKTFHRGDAIEKVDEGIIARIRIGSASPGPDAGLPPASVPLRPTTTTPTRKTSA